MPAHSRPKDGVATLAYVAGIHALLCDKEGVDGRDKPGHDGGGVSLGPEFTGFVSRVLDLFFTI